MAAVAGAPHVTNRGGFLRHAGAGGGHDHRPHPAHPVPDRTGRRRRRRPRAVPPRPVLAVGGYDGRMATEDIDLSWRLLLAAGRPPTSRTRSSACRSPRRCGRFGRSVALGARPGRGAARPPGRDCGDGATVACGGSRSNRRVAGLVVTCSRRRS